MKQTDQVQLAFKKEEPIRRAVQPRKMIAWENPDFDFSAGKNYLFPGWRCFPKPRKTHKMRCGSPFRSRTKKPPERTYSEGTPGRPSGPCSQDMASPIPRHQAAKDGMLGQTARKFST